jgi:iron complex transport system ATP-binding protein
VTRAERAGHEAAERARDTRPAVLALQGVGVVRDGTHLLAGIDWTVRPGERWVVLGPNGSGKTTLLRLCGAWIHPTTGTVDVLGLRLGRTDVRRLRERIGFVSASISRSLLPGLTAADVVVSARHGALEPWWHTYSEADRSLASEILAGAGFAEIAQRSFGLLSEGERQQVLVARSVIAGRELLLLDEPAAGLDLGGRELLVARLRKLAEDSAASPTVLVTHHVEEIPPGFTHALLLREGLVTASGPLPAVLNSRSLSECFGLPLRIQHRSGRWVCHGSQGDEPAV